MEESYHELVDFNYEANLLYAARELKKKKIAYQTEEDNSFKLFVRSEDHAKALAIVDKLDLDESEVGDECDGYIEGYKEWIAKQYVNGYFTGGVIPRWMYSKRYAKWFGPMFIAQGLFFSFKAGFDDDGIWGFALSLIYIIFGTMVTNRVYKK